jgi:signal transduction histidine kinase
MGNVAHDLKTPLHSIEADLEVLNKFISRIPQQLLDSLIKDFQVDCGGDSCDPQSVFNSLTATCQFMVMAINRSQDFMKATNNIALTPEMETFDLKAAVEMSVTCINHLQTARTIVVHPYPAEMCMHVISDKHWLSENILCLLSNALKYSDGGDVDVRIKITDLTGLKKEPFIKRHSRVGGAQRRITWTGTTEDEKKELSLARSPGQCETPKRILLVTVEDNGIGISEEARQTLFQPFKQAQRMAGGTGLGLFSLLKRVEALGGSCGVGSRIDGLEGSIFWFTFPYRCDSIYVDCVLHALV